MSRQHLPVPQTTQRTPEERLDAAFAAAERAIDQGRNTDALEIMRSVVGILQVKARRSA